MQTSNSSLFQISLLFPLTLVVACSLGGGPSENELVGDGDGDGAPIDRNGVGGNHSTTGGGGNAGGDGDGDTSGSGGSNSSTPPAEQCLGDSLIDDFESPLTYSLYRPYHDGTQGGVMNHGASFAAENSPEGAGAALHLFGSGFTTWGAGIGRNFDAPLACKGRSVGLRFRAQGPGTITVAAPVTAIVPVEEGGSCTAVEACHNAHEKSVTLSATWQSYEVLWSELAQLPG